MDKQTIPRAERFGNRIDAGRVRLRSKKQLTRLKMQATLEQAQLKTRLAAPTIPISKSA